MTSIPNQFSDLVRLHIGPRVVLGYFILRFKSWDGFRLFLQSPNTEPLDGRGAGNSFHKVIFIFAKIIKFHFIKFLPNPTPCK